MTVTAVLSSAQEVVTVMLPYITLAVAIAVGFRLAPMIKRMVTKR